MKRGFLLKKVAAPQARTREKISEVQQLAAPQAAVQTSDVPQLAAPQTSVEVLGIAASKLFSRLLATISSAFAKG